MNRFIKLLRVIDELDRDEYGNIFDINPYIVDVLLSIKRDKGLTEMLFTLDDVNQDRLLRYCENKLRDIDKRSTEIEPYSTIW